MPDPIVVLVNCGRCVGVWTSAVVTFAAALTTNGAPNMGWLLLGWLGCAGAVSLLVSVAP